MLHISTIKCLPTHGRRAITSTPLNNAYNHRAIADGLKVLEHRRRPSRGGQNLSDRYIRLEKSIRGKEAFSNDLERLMPRSSSTAFVALPYTENVLTKAYPKPVQVFRGFKIPEKPKIPADDECCMSGCAVCVYDLYEESLEAYQEALGRLRSSLSALKIPEFEWPPSIQTKDSNTQSQTEKRKDIILSAFEEMERTLALKKQTHLEGDGVQQNLNGVSSIAHVKNLKRHQLAEKMKEAPRDTFLHNLYQGLT